MNYIKRLKIHISAGLFLAVFCFAGHALAAENITQFQSHIVLDQAGGAEVTETITYDFSGESRHGIFRDIPLTSTDGPELVVNVLSVTDTNGAPYTYTTSRYGDVLNIKIGDADILISGQKTYVISYMAYNAIRSFEDHDELYWNVTGNGWSIPLANVSATIDVSGLPDLDMTGVTSDCYTGALGSTETDCRSLIDGLEVSYTALKSFGPEEGMTISLSVPKGVINAVYVEPSTQDGAVQDPWFMRQIVPFIKILIAFVFITSFFRILSRFGNRKVKIPRELKNRSIVTEFEPPEDLSPIEIGAILNRQVDSEEVSSIIVDLAVRGYLYIKYITKERFILSDTTDYEFIKLKDGSDLVNPADKALFELFFTSRDRVTFSELQESPELFQEYLKKIEKGTEDYLGTKGYFDKKAESRFKKLVIYLTLLGGLAIYILFSMVVSFLNEQSSLAIIIFVIATIIFISCIVIIENIEKKLTSKGVEAFAKILGFKKFLEMTEKDRLAFFNAPKIQPEIFEKFLPYAMVLGVEKEWAKQFESLYLTPPGWYDGAPGDHFNSVVFASSLVALNTSFNETVSSTTPQSSGSGGGGSSGGGSGGGGGGSW